MFDDRWFHVACPFDLSHIWCHIGACGYGNDRSLAYPLQFPSLDRDILYSPQWPLLLSSSSIWALSGASFETRRVPFSHFQRIEIYSSMPHRGVPPSLGSSNLLRTFSLHSLFLGLCESFIALRALSSWPGVICVIHILEMFHFHHFSHLQVALTRHYEPENILISFPFRAPSSRPRVIFLFMTQSHSFHP